MINSNKNILFGNFKSINLKKILLVFTMLFTLGISNSHLAIAEENPNLHIKFKAQPNKTSIKAGETFDILVNFEIAKYWYTYGLTEQLNSEGIGPTKTEFTLSNPKLELFGEIKSDKPHSKMDEGFGMKIDYFVGNANFIISAKAKSDFDLTKDTLSVITYLQQCDTTSCLQPEEFYIKVENVTSTFDSSILKTEVEEKYTDNSAVQKTESENEIDAVKKKGIFSFLWFAMAAGAFALLTPCVFPMIPITVSFFTKRAEKAHHNPIRDAVIYALGIIGTFTGIGVLLALVSGPTGVQDFATNPWSNLVIAAVFLIFSLNLFGAFEIQIPYSILNKLNAKSEGGGIWGILLMGLTFSLTSFTCTVPFVGTTLISASAGGDWTYPIIGMLGFSGVFAAPFFLLALFPRFLNKLPKAGGWMNNLKVVMGFLEIAAAIKFISNADLVWNWGFMTRDLFLSIWIACGILIVIYVLGFFKLKLDSPIDRLGAVRVVFAVLFMSITMYLYTGYTRPLGELDAFLPPPDYNKTSQNSSFGGGGGNLSQSEELHWYSNYEEALAVARKENKPLFVDFTGWTCTNCRWMELNMFPKSDVNNLMKDMVLVRLYTDRKTDEELKNKAMMKEKYNSIALPLYVIIDNNEQLLGTKEFTRNQEDFVGFLKKGKI
ncbi:MAG: cytochrome c biogenesis protein CcdA [Candidatus Kapaibacteriota bacterium]